MNHEYNKSLVWLRRDLRLLDHTALSKATAASKHVAVAFVFDTEILKHLKDKSDRRLSFIFDSLAELGQDLKKKGSELILRFGNPAEEIPKLAQAIGADAVYVNQDYEVYAVQRDTKVAGSLRQQGIEFHSFKDQVVFSGDEVLKSDDTPYQVFTPYKKTWLKKLKPPVIQVQEVAENFIPAKDIKDQIKKLSLEDMSFRPAKYFYEFQKPGRKNAIKQLKKFAEQVDKYNDERDFPALEGTSGLSVHLRFGTLSVRECVRMAIKSRSKGHQVWLSELIWRDFYQMILMHFPHVSSKAFKRNYQDLKWPGSDKHFQAWCAGQTGFPIVDAGMRQLNETGWMHNRLRMIVASFLTKDLLVHWRKGEAYFAEKLLDFDLASNNGGWQWSASTGCDAQPYFRIFNPWLQSKKFDSEAKFIKKFLPELKSLTAKEIHQPIEGLKSYPEPIVDHQVQKLQALKLFKG